MTATAVEFGSFDDFAAADTSDMHVVVNGKITDWVWTFAGPGHPQTIAQNDRIARESMHEERKLREQQLNGRKVKLPEDTVDERRKKNIDHVVERLVGWSPVKIAGADYPFTADNARALLSKPGNVALLTQSFEHLASDAAFSKRSA